MAAVNRMAMHYSLNPDVLPYSCTYGMHSYRFYNVFLISACYRYSTDKYSIVILIVNNKLSLQEMLEITATTG